MDRHIYGSLRWRETIVSIYATFSDNQSSFSPSLAVCLYFKKRIYGEHIVIIITFMHTSKSKNILRFPLLLRL